MASVSMAVPPLRPLLFLLTAFACHAVDGSRSRSRSPPAGATATASESTTAGSPATCCCTRRGPGPSRSTTPTRPCSARWRGPTCGSPSWCPTRSSRSSRQPRTAGSPKTCSPTTRRRGSSTCWWATRCSPTTPSPRPPGRASCRRWRTSTGASARAASAASRSGPRSPWTRLWRPSRARPPRPRSAPTSLTPSCARCSGSSGPQGDQLLLLRRRVPLLRLGRQQQDRVARVRALPGRRRRGQPLRRPRHGADVHQPARRNARRGRRRDGEAGVRGREAGHRGDRVAQRLRLRPDRRQRPQRRHLQQEPRGTDGQEPRHAGAAGREDAGVRLLALQREPQAWAGHRAELGAVLSQRHGGVPSRPHRAAAAVVVTATAGAGEQHAVQEADMVWCVLTTHGKKLNETTVGDALTYACGQGNGMCNQPNTAAAHASYAFNLYWQQLRKIGATCYFNNLAEQTTKDPSYGSCKFHSSLG